MGQKPPHVNGLRFLSRWLMHVFGFDLVRVQAPMQAVGIDNERSVPEPDVVLLREDKAGFRERHPRGNEVRLAVEVADTSASVDLSRKAQIYALAGVHEYWVLDLQRRRLVVHRQNGGEQYGTIQSLSENDMASVEGHAESIRVGELLP